MKNSYLAVQPLSTLTFIFSLQYYGCVRGGGSIAFFLFCMNYSSHNFSQYLLILRRGGSVPFLRARGGLVGLLTFIFVFPVFAYANVVISELAWMGTTNSANDEWIELYNSGTSELNLQGWTLRAVDGSPSIDIGDSCSNTILSAGGYFLFERTDDESVPGIMADCIYVGALGNNGEHIQLFDISGAVHDSINASAPPSGEGWPAGDNTTKETMQRVAGEGWITAVATPKASNATVNMGDTSDVDSAPDKQENYSSGDGSMYVPPENLPRITADAGGDTRAVVGEEVQFRGQAWGLLQQPLENARYLWNFGDGTTQEGQNFGHAFMFPGTYTVRLTVSSEKYTAFDDIRIIVGKNKLIISEVLPGVDGWIELYNNGDNPIHIGNWIVKNLAEQFIIPLGTTIAPKSFTVLAARTTKLFVIIQGDSVSLLYPNGSFATGISYIFQIPSEKSVSNYNNTTIFTVPTPGEPNSTATTFAPIAIVPKRVFSPPIPVAQKTTGVFEDTEDLSKEERAVGVNQSEQEIPTKTASLGNAPAFSKKYRESLWFAVSLIAGGLLAVVVVIVRRRRA
jgi:PKD repeat protein